MASGWTELAPARIVATEPQADHEDLTDNTTGNVVLSFRTAPGLKGFITAFKQAWDTTIVPAFSLRINGAIPANYNGLRVQLANPWDDVDLPVPIAVEQMSLIEVVVDVDADAATPGLVTGDFAAAVTVKYVNP